MRNAQFRIQRGLARVWGMVPWEPPKTALIWVLGPRFLVSVLAVVFDRHDRVLLLQHTHDRAHPWGLPSGRLEAHETPVEALRRELLEEAGLGLEVGAVAAIERGSALPVLRLAYLCRHTSGAFRPSVEVTDARYFPLDGLPPSLRAGQRSMIDQARKVRTYTCESW